jgi:hypothetical protein
MRPVGNSGLVELDDQEIALAMKVGEQLKFQLAIIAQTAMKSAEETGIPDYIIMSALCTEALLLAACCHNGTPASFQQMVDLAIVDACKYRSPKQKARTQ